MAPSDFRFFEIIDRFSGFIKAIIFKNLYQSRIDPEDVEQEVRLKLWKFLKKGNKIDNLPSFIMRAVYTITMDELRKMRKQMPPADLVELKHLYLVSGNVSGSSLGGSPEAVLEQRELNRQVREAIESLSENRKQVLRLYVQGMSVDEICAFFGWDRIKVRHFLYRGIEDLKAIFAGESIPEGGMDGRAEGTPLGTPEKEDTTIVKLSENPD
jgi:RNA polymerase sigma factor (sigma-70 family)